MAKPADRGRVTALILAAGSSSRLGKPKQLLLIDGETLIHRVARIATSSTVDETIVVVGNCASDVERAVMDLPCRIIENPDFAEGQSTSFKAGIRAIDESTDAVVVLLGDQPLVTTEAVDAVVNAWRGTRAPLVQSEYRGVRSHPVLFDRSVFPDLMNVSGDTGASQVLRARREQIVPARIDGDVPLDIDTLDDYRRVLELI